MFRVTLIGIALAVAGMAFVLLHPFAAQPQAEAASTFEVSVTDAPFRWNPGGLTVPVGSTVRWTMSGPAPHTVTSEGCGDSRFGDCVFDSGTETLLRAGTPSSSFEFTFSKPGVYPYYCRLHGLPGGRGQFGTVVVYEPGQSLPGGAYQGDDLLLQPNASVAILSPGDGQVLPDGRIDLKFDVRGATLRAPQTGLTDPRFGHFHVVVDTAIDVEEEVPRAAPGVYHVAANSLALDLAPGKHHIAVYWGLDNHFLPFNTIVDEIDVTVAAPVRPPSTGDAGLVNGEGDGALPVVFVALLLGSALIFVAGTRCSSISRTEV